MAIGAVIYSFTYQDFAYINDYCQLVPYEWKIVKEAIGSEFVVVLKINGKVVEKHYAASRDQAFACVLAELGKTLAAVSSNFIGSAGLETRMSAVEESIIECWLDISEVPKSLIDIAALEKLLEKANQMETKGRQKMAGSGLRRNVSRLLPIAKKYIVISEEMKKLAEKFESQIKSLN